MAEEIEERQSLLKNAETVRILSFVFLGCLAPYTVYNLGRVSPVSSLAKISK